jgi:sec-independent protein translocase protein TatA
MSGTLLFLGSLGMQEILVIGLVLLVLFGARKIPEFMKGLGKGVREFKDGIKEVKKDAEDSPNGSPTTTRTANGSTTTAHTAKTSAVEEQRDMD